MDPSAAATTATQTTRAPTQAPTQAPNRAQAQTEIPTPGGSPGLRAFGADGPTFWDLLDVINPLQHIPVVSTLYRAATGDSIDPAPRVMGGLLFGGPLGLAASIADVMVEENTGTDLGQHVLALFEGEGADEGAPGSGAATAVAAANPAANPEADPAAGLPADLRAELAATDAVRQWAQRQSRELRAARATGHGDAAATEEAASAATRGPQRPPAGTALALLQAQADAAPAPPPQDTARQGAAPQDTAPRNMPRRLAGAARADAFAAVRAPASAHARRPATATDTRPVDDGWFAQVMLHGLAKYRAAAGAERPGGGGQDI